MNQAMRCDHLVLPSLAASIPLQLFIPGESELATPLAMALLQTDLVTDSMLNPIEGEPNIDVAGEPDERELVMLSLSVWWDQLRAKYPLHHFKWTLHIQKIDLSDFGIDLDISTGTGWFCISRNYKLDMPRYAIGNRIMALESIYPGLGQTVLALFRDSVSLMPDALDYWRAECWAEVLHWEDSVDDNELVANRMHENNYKSITECLANESLMTRAKFYQDMPPWATRPKRVCARKAIGAAVTDPWALNVIAACDELSNLACSKTLRYSRWDVGCHETHVESIDGFAVILWQANDAPSQVLDEYCEMNGNSGEYCDFIDAHPVSPNPKELKVYLERIEQVMRLAIRVEALLELIGEPI